MNDSMNYGIKEKLQRGDVVIGSFIKAVSPALVEILGMSGMDYVLFDMEHGPVSMERLEDLIRAADAKEICSFVRVAGHEESDILHALDKGPGGILVPMVSNKKTAQQIVNCARYAPLGLRGVDIYSRTARFGYIPKADYFQKANQETLLAVQIEGEEGVDNLEEILSVDGIDIVYIGPYDLSQAMGIPGQIHDEKVKNKVAEITKTAKSKGMVVGVYVDDVETARTYAKLGIQFISISVDVRIFAEACNSLVQAFHCQEQSQKSVL